MGIRRPFSSLITACVKNYLHNFSNKVTTISPIVNAQSLKGPTAKMMQELGQEVSVKTIAKFYKNYSKRIFIDSSDVTESDELNELGYEVHIADLVMNSLDKKNALANTIIDELESK